MPKISVVMPAYNAEKYIAEAIDSILAQTFGDFEFIILNDCSTDRTEQIILSYSDSRIVYLKNEKNMGVAATLNRGLSVARGEYIARMDADDISLPERFARQVTALDTQPLLAAVGCNAVLFWEDGKEKVTDMPCHNEEIQLRMAISNPFIHPTMMLRKSALPADPYEHLFEGREDYRLWMRISQKHAMQNLPEVLFRYRHHSTQVTQKPDASKAEKHFMLKKQYYHQLDMELTEAMAEALCQAAYYGKVENPEMAESLKQGLWEIARHYGQASLPKEYEQLLVSAAVAAGVTFRQLRRLTAGMGLKNRLTATIRYWKG